jgi:hypothetical protein
MAGYQSSDLSLPDIQYQAFGSGAEGGRRRLRRRLYRLRLHRLAPSAQLTMRLFRIIGRTSSSIILHCCGPGQVGVELGAPLPGLESSKDFFV